MTILVQQQMTEADRKQLREICDKATQGDWWIDSHGHRMVSRPRFDTVFEASSSMGPAVRHPETGNLSHWPNDWDATYIVAAQPKVVRGLLDEIDRLQAENQELKSAKHTIECRFEVSEDTLSCIRGCLRSAEGDIDQLKAEAAELKDGLNRIIRETRLGDVVFGIACEVMGELGVQQDPEEQKP